MYNREEIKRTELDQVTERFRKVIEATRNDRREPMLIEAKGSTLYKVNRSLVRR